MCRLRSAGRSFLGSTIVLGGGGGGSVASVHSHYIVGISRY